MNNRFSRGRVRLLVAALATTLAYASTVCAADDTVAAQQVSDRLAATYPKTPFRDVKPAPLPGLYEVSMGETVAYTDSTGRYFLFGHLYDMQDQVDITEQRKAQGYKTRFPAAVLNHAIKTVRGNGQRVLAVFSDPDCPYCHQLEQQLAMVDNVTIYTFLYPLESLHPDAMTKSIRIQCSADPAKAWREWMTESRLPPLVSCHHPINDNIVLGSRLGITGTPTIIAEDGRMLPGAVSAAHLSAWLDAGTRAASASAATQPQGARK
ncbi:DsbC family protein [Burkholderia pseudomallei]|uniref:Thiol:disulfide interchange protein n=1 Tax=Burkholderia pseudomallei TaxID=28450 RepID=A0AA40JI58_BURPE|nr:DsbC family protein [Burkholderia pseudomallei]KGX17215.1 DSBA-like thioredoxin domain protein [Burkholderia pseudomallei]